MASHVWRSQRVRRQSTAGRSETVGMIVRLLPPQVIAVSLQIFVYGTLRQGQCREHCWPRSPQQVATAFAQGELYDLGPYPALLTGDDLVRGECWTVRAADLAETLQVLDVIEGFAQPGEADLYRRQVVDVFICDGDPDPTGEIGIESLVTTRAYAYFLVPERLPAFAKRIHPRQHRQTGCGLHDAGGAADLSQAVAGATRFPYASWPDDGRTVEETSSLADPFDPLP